MVGLITSMLFSRFWWRDTRMQELLATNPNTISEFAWATAQPNGEGATTSSTAFPYPMTFVPTPHHSDMSLPNLLSTIIPMARSPRTISIIPRRPSPRAIQRARCRLMHNPIVGTGGGEVQRIEVQVQSEGLLLYVSQATIRAWYKPIEHLGPDSV
jgi:snurportin-1